MTLDSSRHECGQTNKCQTRVHIAGTNGSVSSGNLCHSFNNDGAMVFTAGRSTIESFANFTLKKGGLKARQGREVYSNAP